MAVLLLLIFIVLFTLHDLISGWWQYASGPTTVLACLLLAWIYPPAGIVSLLAMGAIISMYGVVLPIWICLPVLVIVLAVVHPVWELPWHDRAVALWRHVAVGALAFAELAKGQLQTVKPGAAAIAHNSLPLGWSLVIAVVAAGISMLALGGGRGRFAIFGASSKASDVPSSRSGWGVSSAFFTIIGVAIYGAGFIALIVFVLRQLSVDYSIIGRWT